MTPEESQELLAWAASMADILRKIEAAITRPSVLYRAVVEGVVSSDGKTFSGEYFAYIPSEARHVVCGRGPTPAAAMEDFDERWTTPAVVRSRNPE